MESDFSVRPTSKQCSVRVHRRLYAAMILLLFCFGTEPHRAIGCFGTCYTANDENELLIRLPPPPAAF